MVHYAAPGPTLRPHDVAPGPHARCTLGGANTSQFANAPRQALTALSAGSTPQAVGGVRLPGVPASSSALVSAPPSPLIPDIGAIQRRLPRPIAGGASRALPLCPGAFGRSFRCPGPRSAPASAASVRLNALGVDVGKPRAPPAPATSPGYGKGPPWPVDLVTTPGRPSLTVTLRAVRPGLGSYARFGSDAGAVGRGTLFVKPAPMAALNPVTCHRSCRCRSGCSADDATRLKSPAFCNLSRFPAWRPVIWPLLWLMTMWMVKAGRRRGLKEVHWRFNRGTATWHPRIPSCAAGPGAGDDLLYVASAMAKSAWQRTLLHFHISECGPTPQDDTVNASSS